MLRVFICVSLFLCQQFITKNKKYFDKFSCRKNFHWILKFFNKIKKTFFFNFTIFNFKLPMLIFIFNINFYLNCGIFSLMNKYFFNSFFQKLFIFLFQFWLTKIEKNKFLNEKLKKLIRFNKNNSFLNK